jgi:type II secretory ATPase GspE/PulE/Tfp pilus assembly ATPase PilB-like protein
MSSTVSAIGQQLLDLELISEEQLMTAQNEQTRTGERLTVVLEQLGYITYNQLKDTLELQFGVNFVSFSRTAPDPDIARAIPQEIARKYKILPMQQQGTHYTVAMVDPDDAIALDQVRSQLKTGHFKKLVCTEDDLEYTLDRLYAPVSAQSGEPGLESVDNAMPEPAIESDPEQAPLVVTPPPAKMLGKKHLQSLFGDDDELDDFEKPVSQPAQSPAVSMPVEPDTETITAPSPAPSPASSSATSPAAFKSPAKVLRKAFSFGDDDDEDLMDLPSRTAPSEPIDQNLTKAPQEQLQDLVPAALPETLPNALPAALPAALIEGDIDSLFSSVANELSEHAHSQGHALLHGESQQKFLEDVVENELGNLEEIDFRRMKEAQDASVMLLAHEIVGKATLKKCSDIHLEPDPAGVSLRYFLHGDLLADCILPGQIHDGLVSSYKIIAGLDPNVRDKPQDKKFVTRVEEDDVELRITTMPADGGEMVAISIRFI